MMSGVIKAHNRSAGAAKAPGNLVFYEGAVLSQTIDEVVAYRALPPAGADVTGLTAALEAGSVDAITFTSSSTVRNFVALLGRPATARLLANGRPAVACIGPVTAATARDLGLRVDVMPAAYTAAALAAALVQHFGKAAA